ncbi:MAG: DUF1549 domain-containing protein [Akkermansiaceae bacterium]
MKPQLFLTGLIASLSMHVSLTAKPFSQEMVRSTSNEIDQLVAAYLQKKKVVANPVIDDATFVRRSYIAIAGRIPTAEEAREFIEDRAKNKRKTLVDSLIHSTGYKSKMFNYWADMLRLQTNDEKYGLGWHAWIRDAVDQNMPYDKFVHAMVGAEGMATRNPAVGYYLRDRNMLLDNVSNTAQVFLGTQIGCAQCHDHPFDDWTQKQYYQFAAFAGGTEYKSAAAQDLLRRLTAHTMKEKGHSLRDIMRKNNDKKEQRKKAQRAKGEAKRVARDYASMFKDFRKNAIADNPNKSITLPSDYQYNDGKPGDSVSPKTLFGASLENTPPAERRKAFASWITSRDNPYFTKVIVNRLWGAVFGRGIVEPQDDWSETTTVSHPELLEYLCKVMKATDYDVKQFMRILYHTRLFESAVASAEAEMGGSYNFRGPLLRRMSAEELYDSMQAIEYGNRDDSVNYAIKQRWQGYVKSVDTLFKMPLPQLIALDKASDAKEKEVYALRAEARKLKLAITKAKGEGDMKKADRIQRQLREKYMAMKRKEKQGGDEMMGMIMQRRLGAKARPFMRSSEQPAPAKPGSFMRQFGASDRESPNASHTQASIPQTLTLLNGRAALSLADGKGLLAKNLRAAGSPSARLEMLFLSIYGAMPTEQERKNFEPLMENPRDIGTLAKAMMNSKRFLFIQ